VLRFLAEAFALLRPRPARLVLAVAFGVAALGSALALAAVSAWLITRAWQMPPVLHLSVAVVTVRALGIGRGVFGYCERLASHDAALRAAGNARTGVYRALAEGPEQLVMRVPTGQLLTRVGASVDELASVLVRAVLPMAVAAVLSVAAVVVIGVISPAAALVLAAALVVAGVLAPWLAARAATATEAVADRHHADRDAAVLLALEHAPELRVGGRLDAVLAEARRRHHAWGRAADAAAAPAALAAAAPTAATGAAVLGAVLAGIALAGQVAPTTLAILMLLPLSAFEATAALPGAAVQLTRSRIAARRLAELTAAAPAARARPAVAGLTVAPGDRVAVTGPSGSGKTTLLLATAERYRDGERPAVFLAEDAHLFATTVRDNLLVARGDADDTELAAALDRVGLGDWLAGLPQGLDTVLEAGAGSVSAGQRRRLLLARALLCRAPILLLDEPTEHLDARDAGPLLADILTPGGLFGADRAVVVATHQLPDNVACRTVRVGAE